MQKKGMIYRVFIAGSLLLLAACGLPSFEATLEQRNADLDWVFSTFDRNYAPLEWKQKNLGVNFEAVKTDCYEKNKAVKTNDEFRALVWSCVAKFQDAHTVGAVAGEILPGKANMAYLGFSTERYVYHKTETTKDAVGKPTSKTVPVEAIRIADFLPTTDPTNYALKKGDLIVEVNGQAAKDYVLQNLVTYRNLGQESSNLSDSAAIFALRSSLILPIPTEDTISLKIVRNGADGSDEDGDVTEGSIEVKLPWIKKDLFTFAKEQEDAVAKKKLAQLSDPPSEKIDGRAAARKTKAHQPINAIPSVFQDLLRQAAGLIKDGKIGSMTIRYLMNSSRIIRTQEMDAGLGFAQRIIAENIAYDRPNESTTTPPDKKKKDKVDEVADRSLPEPSVIIANDAFDAAEIVSNGKRIMYVRVGSFDINDTAMKSLGELFAHYRDFKFDGLVLDLLDNPGGLLDASNQLANMLTPKKLKLSQIQVRLNDNWVDSAASSAYFDASDTERAWGARLSQILNEDRQKGLRISRPIPTEELEANSTLKKQPNCVDIDPKVDDPELICLPENTRIVVLINEWCASACDIFSSVVKDNNLAHIMGAKAMGAGGNVVPHMASPVSRIMLRQTESLLVDAEGKYIENNGVVPDEEIKNTVNDRVDNSYQNTIQAAVDYLTALPAVATQKATVAGK